MGIKNLSDEDSARRTRLIYCIYNVENSVRSKSEIAESAGYTPEYLSRLISGERRVSDEAVKHFAKALNVRKEFLLGLDDYMTEKDYQTAFKNMDDIGSSISSISASNSNRVYSPFIFEPILRKKIEDSDFLSFLIASRNSSYWIDLDSKRYIEITADEYVSLCDEISEFIKFKIDRLFNKKNAKNYSENNYEK